MPRRREVLDERWLRRLGYRVEGTLAVPLTPEEQGPQRLPRVRPPAPAPEPTWDATTLVIPGLRLLSEANVREGHWGPKAKRAKVQRVTVYWALVRTGWRRPALPCTIRLVRVAMHALDPGDNLNTSLKAVRDGVADWFAGAYGVGQDRRPGLHWAYGQRQGAVAVEITLGDEESNAITL